MSVSIQHCTTKKYNSSHTEKEQRQFPVKALYFQVKPLCSLSISAQIYTNQTQTLFASLHFRPYLARQLALHWWREEPCSVWVQWLRCVWLQTFRRCRSGVHPEAHSRVPIHPEPGQQRRGRFPHISTLTNVQYTCSKQIHVCNSYKHQGGISLSHN